MARPTEVDELDEYLIALDQPPGAWPQGCRGGAAPRSTMAFNTFRKGPLGRRLDAELGAEGEQPMSEPEFIGLRAYTVSERASSQALHSAASTAQQASLSPSPFPPSRDDVM